MFSHTYHGKGGGTMKKIVFFSLMLWLLCGVVSVYADVPTGKKWLTKPIPSKAFHRYKQAELCP